MKILISGSGIAGAAAALYLARDGHDLTVIDRAPMFRPVGYSLSLKNFGVEVMRDLGLSEELQAHAISVDTIRIREADGTVLKAYSASDAADAARGAVAVCRADLHTVLVDAVRMNTAIRFGTSIHAMFLHNASVDVELSDGATETFDLVIVAEGVHSTTRALLWPGIAYRPFDVLYAAANVESADGTDVGVVDIYTGVGTNFGLVPMSTTRTLLYAYVRGTFDRSRGAGSARELMAQAFRDFNPRVTRLIGRLEAAEELFCDGIGLVQLPSLSNGRVVLVGDAGYCPTFLSGMGASLGLIGAKALQRSLGTSENIANALARYDNLMLPLTRHFQENARRHVESLLTLSPVRTWVRDAGIRLLPQGLLGRAFGKQFDAEHSLVSEILGSAA